LYTGFSSTNLLALEKTYSFAIFGLCFGSGELQMCMAFSVGYFLLIIFSVNDLFNQKLCQEILIFENSKYGLSISLEFLA